MSPFKSSLLPFSLVVLASVGLSGMSVAQEAKPTRYQGPRWEYRALRIPDRQQARARDEGVRARKSGSEDILNQLGTEGWELVTVRNDDGGDPVFYFKRRTNPSTPRVRRVPAPPKE